MKNTALLAFIFAFVGGFAQTVKVKKDKVLLDKNTEIAKVNTVSMNGKEVYAFSNLNDSKDTVYVDVQRHSNSDRTKSYNWVEFSCKGKTTEVAAQDTKFTLNFATVTARQLQAIPGLLSAEGINFENVAAFVAKEERSEQKQEWLAYKKDLKDQTEQVRKAKIFVNKEGEVFTQENGDKKIGTVRNSGTLTRIFDLDDNLIATYDGQKNTIKVPSDEVFTPSERVPSNDQVYIRSNGLKREKFLVEEVYAKGYVLAHQFQEAAEEKQKEVMEQRQEKVNEERSQSVNLYDLDGEVIDEKGERFTGAITALFETISAEEQTQWGNVEEIGGDKLAQRVLVKYQNEKGRERQKTFKSKDGVRFCVTSTKTCYEGFAIKGAAAGVVSGGLASLSFDTSAFYKEELVRENIAAFSVVTSENTYLLKKANDQRGIALKRNRLMANEEKDAIKDKETFVEYFEDCSAVANAYDTYDLSSLEGITKVLEDYQTCKN